MYYTFLYIATLFVPQPALSSARANNGCHLLWNSKQTLGYENGIQLQVCCNVTSAKVWPLLIDGDDWSLVEAVFQENITADRTNKQIWSDSLQVTYCNDKPEPTLGYAEARNGTKCKHYTGQTFNMRPRQVKLDEWYLICYEQKEQDCLQCHIEVLCKNDFSSECASIWMQSSVRAITNSSMTVWTSIGDHYPLLQWTKLRVNITDQLRGKHLGTFTKDSFKSSYVELRIEHLQPNSWYFVEVCTQIEPPKQFLQTYQLQESLNNDSRQMCQRGLYRTKAASRIGSSAASMFLIIFYFLLYVTT